MRLEIESRIFWVVSTLEPSGARTLTSKRPSSSSGRKFLLTILNSGTVVAKTRKQSTTITQRWRIDHLSMPM